MTRLVKTLIMWLMLLALPAQGMAQASMFACHLKGAPGSALVMDHAEMSHADMDHSMRGMDHSANSVQKIKKNLHGCCNCAPTCAVVLLPVNQTAFGAIQYDALHPVSTPQLPHSADTRRIDRPPKTLAI